jgi:hypothetical protein
VQNARARGNSSSSSSGGGGGSGSSRRRAHAPARSATQSAARWPRGWTRAPAQRRRPCARTARRR